MPYGNPNDSQINGFVVRLYYNFIERKKYRVDAVAKEMQIATDTLYRYIRGENVIPPHRIIDLVRATKDIEYLEYFCEPCGYLPILAAQAKVCDEPREKDQIHLSILNGQALREIEDAFADGRLDKLELRRIEKTLTRLQEKAAELAAKIAKEVRG